LRFDSFIVCLYEHVLNVLSRFSKLFELRVSLAICLHPILLIIGTGLLNKVKQAGDVMRLEVEEPEEGAVRLPDLLRLLAVSVLNFRIRELSLSLCDNRDEQVKHQDNQEEDKNEENYPVKIAEFSQLVAVEVTDAGKECCLPDGEPPVEVCLERCVKHGITVQRECLLCHWLTSTHVVDQKPLFEGIERISKSSHTKNEDCDEV